ncbi:MAG: hypothetical protein ACYTKD_30425 [Planctomycetota bacterium]
MSKVNTPHTLNGAVDLGREVTTKPNGTVVIVGYGSQELVPGLRME